MSIEQQASAANIKIYTLGEIAKWQTDDASKVMLPPIQRGFVWKTQQVEALWDSILRGYPIGSLLLCEVADNEGNRYDLLDGQQRATSITYGFRIPIASKELSPKDTWKNDSKSVPILWLDLDPDTQLSGGRLFCPRLITQAHPWGYSSTNPEYILSVSDRQKALTAFNFASSSANFESYTQMSLHLAYPYDAKLPIPMWVLLNAFREAIDEEAWIESVVQYLELLEMNNLELKGGCIDANDYIDRIKSKLRQNDFPAKESLFEIIRKVVRTAIAANIMPYKLLQTEDAVNDSVDPTLFVRLNAGGTVLRGEELIYSIFKARFPKLADVVKNEETDIMPGSRIVVLLTRIAISRCGNHQYPAALSVKSFLEKTKDSERPEVKKLQELLFHKGETGDGIKAFRDVRSDLEKGSIPAVLVKALMRRESDILLYFLAQKLNSYERINSGIKETDLEVNWFGLFSYISFAHPRKEAFIEWAWDKNLNELLRYFKGDKVECKDINDPLFWSPLEPSEFRSLYEFFLENAESAPNNDYFHSLELEEMKECLKYFPKQNDSTLFDENDRSDKVDVRRTEVIKSIFSSFTQLHEKLSSNRFLLFYFQKEYISLNFKEFNQFTSLTDTNVPWDFDHIYPHSWIKHKQHSTKIRAWNNCIGNLRVLDLSKNRADGAQSPKSKLTESDKLDFKIDDTSWEILSKTADKVGSDSIWDNVRKHRTPIINRLCNIYEDWYVNAGIAKLFKSLS